MAYMKDRISLKLQGWKQICLSQAGKEVLIKVVTMAILSYPMTCFKIPKSLCNQIEAQVSHFLWG